MATRRTLLSAAVGAAVLGLTACAGDDEPENQLAAGAPLPDRVPSGTKLVIGDKEQQKAIEFSGEADKFTFEVEWATISGGPQTLEAFRADALDLGAVADIPPIHSHWTGGMRCSSSCRAPATSTTPRSPATRSRRHRSAAFTAALRATSRGGLRRPASRCGPGRLGAAGGRGPFGGSRASTGSRRV